MASIYKITNLINDKVYIGQTVNLARRWAQHKSSEGPEILHEAMRKYGVHNFICEEIEECPEELLDERERYWIEQYDCLVPNGYNMVEGGGRSYGEYNQNTKYTTAQIYEWRKKVFIDLESPEQLWHNLGVNRNYFYKVLHGDYRQETGSGIELCHSLHSVGEANSRTNLTNKEVLSIRHRVHTEGLPQLTVYQDYKDRISYDAFRKIVTGETWQNVDCSMIKEQHIERAGKPKAKITKEEVAQIRYRAEILGEDVSTIYKSYDTRVSRQTIRRIVQYETWKDVKPVSTIPEA